MTKIRLAFVHVFRDRHGRVRQYFRRQGRRTPLPGLAGSSEFMEAYQALLAGAEPPRPMIGASRTKPGSVSAAVAGYYQCLAFRELSRGTQNQRRAILELFRNEHGDKSIATLPRDFIVRMLNRRAPASARNWLKTLRGLLRFAVAEGFRRDDPTDGLRLPALRSDGFHTWTEDEIARFESQWPIGSTQRLGFALHLYTAQRGSDVHRMTWADIVGDRIKVVQQKTRTALAVPLHPALIEVLDATPRKHLAIIINGHGRAFTVKGFGNFMAAAIREAGLPSRCKAHGLRKAAARRLAEAGCSTKEIAAITGHRTLSEVERYTVEADQKRLADEAGRKVTEAFPRTSSGKPR